MRTITMTVLSAALLAGATAAPGAGNAEDTSSPEAGVLLVCQVSTQVTQAEDLVPDLDGGITGLVDDLTKRVKYKATSTLTDCQGDPTVDGGTSTTTITVNGTCVNALGSVEGKTTWTKNGATVKTATWSGTGHMVITGTGGDATTAIATVITQASGAPAATTEETSTDVALTCLSGDPVTSAETSGLVELLLPS